MRRIAVILLLLAAQASIVVAQEIQLRPRLIAGDEFRLEVTRSREDSAKPESNFVSKTPVDVRVVSANSTGFVIEWKPGLTFTEGGAVASDETMRMAGEIMGDAVMRIVLDEDGSFVRVANQAELLPKLQAAIDLVIKESQGGMEPEAAKRAEQLVRTILSPSNIIALATRDVQTYVSLFGAPLRLNQPMEVPLQQPNPLGGAPLDAVLRLKMTALTAETATITSTITYDGDALKKMTVGLIAQASVKPPPAEVEKFKLDMTDDTRYTYDRVTGLFREVSNDRRISSGVLKRLDKVSIRLVRPPQR